MQSIPTAVSVLRHPCGSAQILATERRCLLCGYLFLASLQSGLLQCAPASSMFKMKGLPWYLKNIAFFSLLFKITTAKGVQVPMTPVELLDQKEKELTDFVAAVEANARNCDALRICSSSEGGCSREACFRFGAEGDTNYQCLDNVQNNTVCGPWCTQRNFDFSRGFVRRVDTVEAHVARTVCTHRTLDNLFRNSSMNDSSHLFRVFFGAVDGTTRLYPGLDEDCNGDYDCRLRPWFIESTDVRKGITLIVDSGISMRDKPAGAETRGETYLTYAKTMALKVLEKLQDDSPDYANIMCFDGEGIKQPNTTSEKYNSSLYQKFNVTLDAAINSTSTQDPSPTDIGIAINAAMLEMGTSVPEPFLKVVIVLTRGGLFDISTPVNISPNSGVNLFVYNFPPTKAVQACNASIRASSETILVERLNNPLYALESYFSFLAKVHRIYVNKQTDYGQKYPDASGIDNHTLTISKPAFGPNGELIGVVGIDFFETKVHEQYAFDFQSIVDAARHHDSEGIFNASAITLPSVCFNHTEACSSLQNTTIVGLCAQKGGDAKVGCCGACSSLQNTTNTTIVGPCGEKGGDAKVGCCGACKPKKTPWGAILGGTAGAVAVLFGVATVLYCLRHPIARKLEKKPRSQDQPYSGSDE